MITISETAADKIKEILKVEGVPNHALRVTADAAADAAVPRTRS